MKSKTKVVAYPEFLNKSLGATFVFRNTMIIMKEKITGVFLAFLGICFSCQSVKQDKVQGDTHIDYNYLKSHFQNYSCLL